MVTAFDDASEDVALRLKHRPVNVDEPMHQEGLLLCFVFDFGAARGQARRQLRANVLLERLDSHFFFWRSFEGLLPGSEETGRAGLRFCPRIFVVAAVPQNRVPAWKCRAHAALTLDCRSEAFHKSLVHIAPRTNFPNLHTKRHIFCGRPKKTKKLVMMRNIRFLSESIIRLENNMILD